MPELFQVAKERRNTKDARFTWTAQQYLDYNFVPEYMQDVLEQLLELRTDRPLEYIAEFFAGVVNGTHILQREFGCVILTPYNRLSFCALFRSVYSNYQNQQRFTPPEYIQLVRFICADFPNSMIRTVFDICETTSFYPDMEGKFNYVEERGESERYVTFGTFRQALTVHLFYRELFDTLLENVFENDSIHPISLSSFMEIYPEQCRRMPPRTAFPPPKVMDHVLSQRKETHITFVSFCLALYHCHDLPLNRDVERIQSNIDKLFQE